MSINNNHQHHGHKNNRNSNKYECGCYSNIFFIILIMITITVFTVIIKKQKITGRKLIRLLQLFVLRIFFAADLFPKILRRRPPLQGARQRGDAARQRHMLPAGVRNELVQSRRRTGSTRPRSMGISRKVAASARCAAAAMMPLQRNTHAAWAAGRRAAGVPTARARASRCKKDAASAAQRPPTSGPKTTRRQRQHRSSSG